MGYLFGYHNFADLLLKKNFIHKYTKGIHHDYITEARKGKYDAQRNDLFDFMAYSEICTRSTNFMKNLRE